MRFIEDYGSPSYAKPSGRGNPVSTAKYLANQYKEAKNDANVSAALANAKYYDPIYHVQIGNPTTTANTSKLVNNVNKIITETEESQKRYGSSSGGGGAGGGAAGTVAGGYQNMIDLVNKTAQANNEWSAAQAQKQMDFQERMARNAHLYEVEDLKNAGLNPVLSAGGNGAATPTGAMGQTDDSNTRIIAELAASAIESLGNTAAGYASAARLEEGAGFLGKVLNFYNTNKLGKKLIDTGLNTASGVARIVFARKALAGMGLARMFK